MIPQCPSTNPQLRPNFREITAILDRLLSRERKGVHGHNRNGDRADKGVVDLRVSKVGEAIERSSGRDKGGVGAKKRIMSLIDRHSTWF